MKIFEVKNYIDGGPNDRGFIIKYIKSKSRQEAFEKVNKGKSGWFYQVFEISLEEFNKRKKEAENKLKMFKI